MPNCVITDDGTTIRLDFNDESAKAGMKTFVSHASKLVEVSSQIDGSVRMEFSRGIKFFLNITGGPPTAIIVDSVNNVTPTTVEELATEVAGISPNPGVVGGSEPIHYAESLAEMSRTSQTYTDKVALNFTAETADYMIHFSASVRNAHNSARVMVRAVQDGNAILKDEQMPNNKVSNTFFYSSFAGTRKVSLASGAHTFSIQFASNTNGKQVNIRDAVIWAQKVTVA